ncbi:hypothetical protein SDC9_61385 [bioreactor metagenome]|uniref:Uncharacterized protein n=1 Tax=bioreactor metagenome TaxID=1076179 RepID=A0A644XFK5_9ZZZZ
MDDLKRAVAVIAATVFTLLAFLTGCTPNTLSLQANTPEPTPSATAAPTATPSPTPEPTPSPTPTPEPTPVLSREEEIAFLGLEYNQDQVYSAGYYVFIYCVLQNGEKVVIPTCSTWSSKESTDFRYLFNYKIIVTFYPNIYENQIHMEEMLEKTTHKYSIANLDGAIIEELFLLYDFPEFSKKHGIEIIESEEYIKMMDYMKEGGEGSFNDKKVRMGDFANFYVSCLKSENRINAAFVNATVRTRGILAPGQTPYTTPAPTPTPTIAGSF